MLKKTFSLLWGLLIIPSICLAQSSAFQYTGDAVRHNDTKDYTTTGNISAQNLTVNNTISTPTNGSGNLNIKTDKVDIIGVLNTSNVSTTTLNASQVGIPNISSQDLLYINQTQAFDAVHRWASPGTWENNTAEAKTSAGTPFTIASGITPNTNFVGMSSQFNTIYCFLGTTANATLSLKYWNGTAWNTTTATDGTNGFANSGSITFTIPSDWINNATSVGYAGTSPINGTSYYWVAFNNTNADIYTAPNAYVVVPNPYEPIYIQAQPGDTTPILRVDQNGTSFWGGNVPSARKFNFANSVKFTGLLELADTHAMSNRGLTTTSTDGFYLTNYNVASAGTPVRISPRVRWTGYVWNTNASGNNGIVTALMELLPISNNLSNSCEFATLRIGEILNQTGTTLGSTISYPAQFNFTTNNTVHFGLLGTQNITGGLDEIQLLVKGYSTQTNDILQILNNAGNTLFNITNIGNVYVGGNLTLLDTAWEDLRVDLNTVGLVPGATKPDKEVFKNGTYTYSFDASSNESVIFSVQMPHNWKTETAIEPHLHWCPNGTNTSTAVYKLEYTVATINGTFGNTVSIFSNDTADGTALKHQISNFPAIAMTGNNISTMLICNLSRMGGDSADNLTDESKLLGFDFHYQIDSLGSATNSTK